MRTPILPLRIDEDSPYLIADADGRTIASTNPDVDIAALILRAVEAFEKEG